MDRPWENEPDEWQAEMMCAKRHPEFLNWCGYVAVGPQHPLHGAEMDDERLSGLDVHGGITWARDHAPSEESSGELWWFGFDCAHAWDYAPGLVARIRELRLEPPLFPRGTYRDLEYVKAQCMGLARQLARYRPGDMDELE